MPNFADSTAPLSPERCVQEGGEEIRFLLDAPLLLTAITPAAGQRG